MVSLAHGTNDAQKTMGVLTLALVANGTISSSASTPDWVIICCALAISLGTYMGGWRIIRTLGKGLIEIESPQGFAAAATSAAVILSSTHFGIPLSTTQVCSGSVVGAGLGRARPVRWVVFGRMVVTWVVTLPAAAAVGALTFAVVNGIGGDLGVDRDGARARGLLRRHLRAVSPEHGQRRQCQQCLGRGRRRRPRTSNRRSEQLMTVLADSSYVDWPSLWKILLISIGAGAGLVTVYSVGLLALSVSGYLRRGDEPAPHRRNVLALAAAVICLAIVAAAAAYGIHVMLAKG